MSHAQGLTPFSRPMSTRPVTISAQPSASRPRTSPVVRPQLSARSTVFRGHARGQTPGVAGCDRRTA
jgi:hypothetical protein